MTVQEFIEKYLPYAKMIEGEWGIPVSLSLSQAGLETGWGRSIPEGSNNLFGIKESDGYPSISYTTTEDDGTGTLYKTKAGFNIYESPQQAFEHYAMVLYKDHFINKGWRSAGDSIGMITAIQSGESYKYATDKNYVQKITDIITGNDLMSLDYTSLSKETDYKGGTPDYYKWGFGSNNGKKDDGLITKTGEGNPWKNLLKPEYWKNLITGNFSDNIVSSDGSPFAEAPDPEATTPFERFWDNKAKGWLAGVIAGAIILIIVIVVILIIVLMASKGGATE